MMTKSRRFLRRQLPASGACAVGAGRGRRCGIFVILGLVFAGTSHIPYAVGAEGDAAPSAIAEIVVTATKRAESIQNVPLSITALSAQTIEQAGIQTFEDYAAKVPNLTYSTGLGVIDGRQVALRGIQGAGTTALYIDDLPIPSTMDPRAVDWDRIEVLRGPQGTLYGARSMGGTVRLITETPDLADLSGRVHALGAKVDHGDGGYQTDAAVNLPLIDQQAAIRLSAFVGNDGGFINREYPSASDPSVLASTKVARNDFSGGTISVLWKPVAGLTIRPILMTQSTSLNGFPLSDYSASSLSQVRPFNIAEPAWDRWTFGGVSINYSTPIGDITSASSWFSRRVLENEDISQYVSAVLGTPLLPATIDTVKYGHSFVEELRFASHFPGPVQFTGGVYLDREKNNYDQNSTIPGLNDASGGAFGTNLLYADYGPGFDNEDAVFGELTYNISSQWSLTGGFRYSHITVSQFFYSTGIAASGSTTPGGTQTEHDVTPKAVLAYRLSPEVSLYALASKGFRPGDGQMAPPTVLCAADYAAAGLSPAQLDSYKSDSLWNYEIGAKSELFDRRITLNGALFQINWTNLQQGRQFSCGYVFTVNAGSARSRGGEIELSAVPFSGLTVTAGLGYEDAVITSGSKESQEFVGEPVQQVAPWTASLSADYAFPVTSSLKGFVRADGNYTDHSFSANNSATNLLLRQSYDIVNLRAGVRAHAWDVTAFVENIGDTHANLGDNQSEGGMLPGRPRILVNRPRTVGMEATLRW